MYVLYKIQYSPGFAFDSHGYKMLEIGTDDNNTQNGACCNPWVANYTTLYVGPTGNPGIEGNNKGSATPNWINSPQNAGGYSSNPFRLQAGRWYGGTRSRCAGGEDSRAAERELRRELHLCGTNWVMISDYPAYAVQQTQSIYYDDMKFSTTYIGAGTQPPAPPTELPVVP